MDGWMDDLKICKFMYFLIVAPLTQWTTEVNKRDFLSWVVFIWIRVVNR